MIHLIIGKWRTPKHSTQRDDMHEVKKNILKRVGKKEFERQVGHNPDIDINLEDIIILKGVSDCYKKKPYYVTGLSANDEDLILSLVDTLTEKYIKQETFESATRIILLSKS
ncbi:MAG: hypothetical protein LBR75_07020 [Prevotellaceae bacterium]|jgi:hypothetical protein|nr:hypothetical protein [Prevotellaceae bacterium]